jgi:hypothetical protein
VPHPNQDVQEKNDPELPQLVERSTTLKQMAHEKNFVISQNSPEKTIKSDAFEIRWSKRRER